MYIIMERLHIFIDKVYKIWQNKLFLFGRPKFQQNIFTKVEKSNIIILQTYFP
nr:MAG TPA: hypothetical protein [Caudoviricetes sp.]